VLNAHFEVFLNDASDFRKFPVKYWDITMTDSSIEESADFALACRCGVLCDKGKRVIVISGDERFTRPLESVMKRAGTPITVINPHSAGLTCVQVVILLTELLRPV